MIARPLAALDALLGRVTMYLLVIIALGAVAILALVLSALGALHFSPLAWLASLAVALAAVIGTTLIASAIVRAHPHLPSSVITALLLFLIFTPSLAPGALGSIAIAGAVAGVSKFALAVRGRHLFNPAAIGALAVGVLQSLVPGAPFSFATWWVATPPLLPLVAVGALLVLWRTSTLTMGLLFVLLAGAIATTRMAVNGLDIGGALAIAFGSLAIVFFAGFMLSEPLTLPPRRGQRLLEAAVVAVLFAVPFSLGPVFSSPELALVVGNLIGFAFGQRRRIRLRLAEHHELAPGTWELRLRPAASVRFTPGQFIELGMRLPRPDARGSRRVFSIASPPDLPGEGPGLLRVAFTVPRSGPVSAFKSGILAAPVGTELVGTGVGGDFVWPARADAPLLLVAGGIGITPFLSQVNAPSGRGGRRDVVLVYATGASGRPPFADELEAAGTPVVLFSPEPPSPMPEGWALGGTGLPSAELIAAAVPDLAERRVFISGPPAMVSALGRALRRAGARHVRRDVFAGY